MPRSFILRKHKQGYLPVAVIGERLDTVSVLTYPCHRYMANC